MNLIVKILTPVAALCLLGSGCVCAAQEKHFNQPTAKNPTKNNIPTPDVFLTVRCNEPVEGPWVARVSSPSDRAQPSSDALQEPAFLKQPLLFTPNGLNLTASSKKTLNCAAAWLREHRGARILIVGYCDDSGSEACDTALADGRAKTVQEFLTRLGTPADQIAGVKRWEGLDRTCRSGTRECQRRNRSVHLFLASPAGSMK